MLIEEMNLNIIRAADIPIEVLERINKLLKLIIPDFSLLSIDELLDSRKNKLFNNLRRQVLRIHEFF